MRRTRRVRQSVLANPISKTLDWDVKIEPVSSGGSIAPEFKALHRTDNNYRLNIVSSKYNPGTNERFKTIVSKLHELTGMDVVGYTEYNKGRKIMAYLENKEQLSIGGFKSTNYLVLGNSFDYSSSLFTGLANKVHRCTNEWGEINQLFRIRHDSKLDEKVEELIHFFEGFMKQQEKMKKKFETWHGIQISPELKELFADEVLEIDNEDEESVVSKIKMNQRKSLFDSIQREIGAMGNNAYGLFNGLTHYTTHVARPKERVFGNIIGHGATMNKRGERFLEKHFPVLV